MREFVAFLLRSIGSITLVMAIGPSTGTAAGNRDMQRLMSDLLSASNKEIRPMRNHTDTLTVAVSLKLSQIMDLDFENQVLTTKVSLEQVWNNYLMRWDEEAYGGIKHIVLPAAEMWVPDLALYNSAGETMFFEKGLVKVFFTGYVEWNPVAILKSHCEFSSEGFPRDQHTCYLKFGSWTYDGHQLDVQPKGGNLPGAEREIRNDGNGSRAVEWELPVGFDLSEFYLSTQWNIISTKVVTGHRWYACCREPYGDVKYTLTVQRRSGPWMVTLVMPWAFLTLLPILTFLIPVSSGQKLTFLVLNFLLLLYLTVPTKTSSGVRAFMSGRYCFSLILDTLIICATVAIIFVHGQTSQMSKSFKDAIARLGTFTCIEVQNDGPNQPNPLAFIDEEFNTVDGRLNEQETQSSSNWAAVSKVMDRILFLVFGLVSAIGVIIGSCWS